VYTLVSQVRVRYSTGTVKENDMDRSKIMQAIAKVLAYKACGKEIKARQWFDRLVQLLGY
jgi:hypothetical protein